MATLDWVMGNRVCGEALQVGIGMTVRTHLYKHQGKEQKLRLVFWSRMVEVDSGKR